MIKLGTFLKTAIQNIKYKASVELFFIITSSPFVASEPDVAVTVVKLDFSLNLFTVSNI